MSANPIRAHGWKVVCDSMLGGVSKSLRMCGVDSIYVEGDVGGERCGEIAENESRVMLTQGFGSMRVIFFRNLIKITA